MAAPNIASTLRLSLLIKVISKPAPSREDVNSVIELTASKVVEALQAQSMTFYLVEGNGTGYKGRVGIHELMVNSEELTEGINKEVEVADLKRIAMKNGMKTLHQDSMLKVKMGLTTFEDALANVPPDLIL
jgi:type II secretory ATPase GspE/PulE/Tfp pilus assembly ATPase PilB-like protein